MDDRLLGQGSSGLPGAPGFGRLFGGSVPMQALCSQVRRIAPTDVTVVLQGESGTGKELIAQTIHDLSHRRDGIFVPINCGAFAASLVESELFGHERGSFTGATGQHRGCFERAHQGTLFLDEITEMQPDLQVKLLRVLETGELVRVGGQRPVRVDVRVIAATNRCMSEAIAEGKLREDLYFRLSAFPLRIPALRERPGDVERLARHFLALLNSADGVCKSISGAALDRLCGYAWPGNVRELKNLLQRAYILADDVIDTEHLPPLGGYSPPPSSGVLSVAIGSALNDVERRLILATLAHYHGDKRRAAEVLGVSLKTIYNRLRDYRRAAHTEQLNPPGTSGEFGVSVADGGKVS
ncbi:MAG: sigma-54 dependent transcriptional regulator [Aquisalimonadaceae bacterium]